MKQTRLSLYAVNAQAEATAKLLDGGYFDLMTGDQPASADDSVPDEMRLARCFFGSVAFGAPRNGVLEANPITKAVATRTGPPTWCRCLTRDGLPILDGSVGKSDANTITKVLMIVEGQIVNITGFKHTISNQAGS